MADGKDREYGHNPIRLHKVIKGLQPVRPVSDTPSDIGPETAGLQPIRPAPPASQGDPGSGGGDKKGD